MAEDDVEMRAVDGFSLDWKDLDLEVSWQISYSKFRQRLILVPLQARLVHLGAERLAKRQEALHTDHKC